MFKESKEGQTHSYNDGCGEPAHNDMTKNGKKFKTSDFEKSLENTYNKVVNYERDYSHIHCWNQEQPSACNIPIEKHTQCCLCDLKSTQREVSQCCLCSKTIVHPCCGNCGAEGMHNKAHDCGPSKPPSPLIVEEKEKCEHRFWCRIAQETNGRECNCPSMIICSEVHNCTCPPISPTDKGEVKEKLNVPSTQNLPAGNVEPKQDWEEEFDYLVGQLNGSQTDAVIKEELKSLWKKILRK